MGDVALLVQDLQAAYGRLQVLYGVTLAARAGWCTVILGPNGAGKSSLLRAIFGQLRLLGGRIVLQGEEVTGLPARELVRRGMVFVPQGRSVFPSLTVEENLAIGRRAAGLGDATLAEREQVLGWFPILRQRLRQRAGTLSGGEQQMLAIARALLTRPRVLLVDEPTLGLAPLVRRLLFRTVRELANQGMTIVMVEQNAREALATADYAYVLEMGRNRLEGEGHALLNDSRLEKLYLGGSTESSLGDAG